MWPSGDPFKPFDPHPNSGNPHGVPFSQGSPSFENSCSSDSCSCDNNDDGSNDPYLPSPCDTYVFGGINAPGLCTLPPF